MNEIKKSIVNFGDKTVQTVEEGKNKTEIVISANEITAKCNTIKIGEKEV